MANMSALEPSGARAVAAVATPAPAWPRLAPLGPAGPRWAALGVYPAEDSTRGLACLPDAESIAEPARCGAQLELRVQPCRAGRRDKREQRAAQLRASGSPAGPGTAGPAPGAVQVGERARRPGRRGAALQFGGEREGWLAERYAVERRSPAALLLLPFGCLDRRPVGLHLVGAGDLDVTKDVRMPAHQFGHDGIADVIDGEPGAIGALGGDPGVKDHLEEHIAEFVPQRVAVSGLQRLECLVGLLDQVARQRAVRLLGVPRTARSERVHGGDKVKHPAPRQVVTALQHSGTRPADRRQQVVLARVGGEPDDRTRGGVREP